jgi:hypothetical protein
MAVVAAADAAPSGAVVAVAEEDRATLVGPCLVEVGRVHGEPDTWGRSERLRPGPNANRSQPGRFGEVDAESVSLPLVTAGHLGAGVAELPVDAFSIVSFMNRHESP